MPPGGEPRPVRCLQGEDRDIAPEPLRETGVIYGRYRRLRFVAFFGTASHGRSLARHGSSGAARPPDGAHRIRPDRVRPSLCAARRASADPPSGCAHGSLASFGRFRFAADDDGLPRAPVLPTGLGARSPVRPRFCRGSCSTPAAGSGRSCCTCAHGIFAQHAGPFSFPYVGACAGCLCAVPSGDTRGSTVHVAARAPGAGSASWFGSGS